jgi:DNA replication and repair protein RecF
MLEQLHDAALEDGMPVRDAYLGTCVAVRRLTLTDFRCYRGVRLEVDARPVVLAGMNGAGKTNLLEAISYLVPGRGLRRARLSEVTRDGGESWAVAAEIAIADGAYAVGTGYRPEAGGKAEKRVVRINGEPAKSQAELGRIASAQWLTPQMDRLFLDGPASRRRFLDRLILGFDPDHAGPLAAYEHSLRGRNKLLKETAHDAAWLSSIEDSMAAHGIAVAGRRLEAIERLRPFCGVSFGPFPGAEIALVGEVESWLAEGPALAAEERLRARLAGSREADAQAGTAAVGPHRSDLEVVHMGNGSAAARCSTGEQKALLVGLVLAAARLQARERGHMPLLLLDEIAAHLDPERLEALFDLLAEMGAQAWMTGTDARLFAAWGDRAQMMTVRDGTIVS